jgi:hypothetical protein
VSSSAPGIEHSAKINTSTSNDLAVSATSPAIARPLVFQKRKVDIARNSNSRLGVAQLLPIQSSGGGLAHPFQETDMGCPTLSADFGEGWDRANKANSFRPILVFPPCRKKRDKCGATESSPVCNFDLNICFPYRSKVGGCPNLYPRTEFGLLHSLAGFWRRVGTPRIPPATFSLVELVSLFLRTNVYQLAFVCSQVGQ